MRILKFPNDPDLTMEIKNDGHAMRLFAIVPTEKLEKLLEIEQDKHIETLIENELYERENILNQIRNIL